MKNLLIGIVLGILLLVLAIVWLVPPLTYDSLPFLWTTHHKNMIDTRAKELLDSLAKDDTDGAIRLTDPNVVMQRGVTIVAVQHKVLAVFVRAAGKDNLRIDEAVLAADAKTAEVKVSHRQGTGKPHLSKWVRVHGKWYVTF